MAVRSLMHCYEDRDLSFCKSLYTLPNSSPAFGWKQMLGLSLDLTAFTVF